MQLLMHHQIVLLAKPVCSLPRVQVLVRLHARLVTPQLIQMLATLALQAPSHLPLGAFVRHAVKEVFQARAPLHVLLCAHLDLSRLAMGYAILALLVLIPHHREVLVATHATREPFRLLDLPHVISSALLVTLQMRQPIAVALKELFFMPLYPFALLVRSDILLPRLGCQLALHALWELMRIPLG
jgi:hypothetical protein